MRFAYWAFVNSLFAASLIGGVGFGIQGAFYIAAFMAWVNFICALAVLISDDPLPESPVPRPVGFSLSVFYVLAFVWHGAFVTAVACLVALVIAWGVRETRAAA